MSVITFFEDVNNKQQCLQCRFRLPCRSILVEVLHQLLQLTLQLHHQVNLLLCRTTTHQISSQHFSCFKLLNFLYLVSKSLTEPLASSDNPRSNKYCHSWNDGRCHCPFGRCRFCHSCETCHKDHPRIHCPRHFARREQPRPLLSERGVTAIILTQAKLHKWYKAFMMVFA